MARGLLAVVFDFASAHADEFHDWYDLEHIPERRSVPGFGASERWLSVEQATIALATYDLTSADVLTSAPYLALAHENLSPWSKRVTSMCTQLLRFEGSELNPGRDSAPYDAGGLLLNAMNVDPQAEDEFNAWYDEEHLPALAGVEGTLAARRYRSSEAGGGSHRYVAIYHLKSPDVVQSEPWRHAADTPWSARIRPHFRDRLRIVAKRYVREH